MIAPDDTEIRGSWRMVAGKIEADANCSRIEQLIESDLRQVARDGRHWELIYPMGQLHGGGPPTLKHLTKEEARNKYGNA